MDSQQLIPHDLTNCQTASGEMEFQDRPWFVELGAQQTLQLLFLFPQIILFEVTV